MIVKSKHCKTKSYSDITYENLKKTASLHTKLNSSFKACGNKNKAKKSHRKADKKEPKDKRCLLTKNKKLQILTKLAKKNAPDETWKPL